MAIVAIKQEVNEEEVKEVPWLRPFGCLQSKQANEVTWKEF